jgi:hypothetical protein
LGLHSWEDGIDVRYEVEYEVESEIESEDGSDGGSEVGSDEAVVGAGLWVQNHRLQSYLI